MILKGEYIALFFQHHVLSAIPCLSSVGIQETLVSQINEVNTWKVSVVLANNHLQKYFPLFVQITLF